MSHKAFTRLSLLVIILVTYLISPASALAGGVCGGTYIVDPGDTFAKIASNCGTTVSAITSANPGITEPLYTGQALIVPGNTYNNSNPATSTSNTYNYNTYYNYYNNYLPTNYNGTYMVQYGDTFAGIASRYGVSVNYLWSINPSIADINYLYAGQVIIIPNYSSAAIVTTPTEVSVPLSYGTVPNGAPYGRVKLSNKANGDVYVSLQGTTTDGTSVINEYPVSKTMNVKIPAAWYTYVAWVGGIKFEGQFHLGGDSDHTITFYNNKVVVD